MPGALTTTIPNTAIHGFAKVMAEQLGKDGITVNTICPGFTATESWGPRAEGMAKMRGITPEEVIAERVAGIPARRMGEPDEFGAVAAFLCGQQAGYCTGGIWRVDGGRIKTIV